MGEQVAQPEAEDEARVLVDPPSTVDRRPHSITQEDVRFFAEGLRAWHEGIDSPQMYQRSRQTAAPARRGIPTMMSAPVGGSAGMVEASDVALRGQLARPLAGRSALPVATGRNSLTGDTTGRTGPTGGSTLPSLDGTRPANALEDPGGKFATSFDYNSLRAGMAGLGKELLVELWIECHGRLMEAGMMEEAEEAYNAVVKEMESASAHAAEAAAAGPGLTGIDLLLKDGLLSFLLKLANFLPPRAAQIVKIHGLNYSSTITPSASDEGFQTVGSKLSDCFLPCLKQRGQPQEFFIMKDFDAFFMPGSLTLVCGPPGCGKTSVHEAAAGRLTTTPQPKGTTLTGEVTYNDIPVSELQPRRMAAFIGQTDQHIPTLTVTETCKFAKECCLLLRPEEDEKLAELQKLLKKEAGGIDLKLEFTLHLLGLRSPANTMVGSRTVRGVSGGERHRVTTAEFLAGVYLIFCFDEISTGLDSSATLDIVSALRTIARVRQMPCLFSLLQPSPEVFSLFDRIIVLSEGKIIFQGPREDALPHFESLGYKKPPHVDVSDFLQELPTPDGAQFLLPGRPHLTTHGFVSAYLKSAYYAEVQRVLGMQQVTQLVWADVPSPLGLSFKENETTGAVTVDQVHEGGQFSEPNISVTAAVLPGDTLSAVSLPGKALPGPKPLHFLFLQQQTASENGQTTKISPADVVSQLHALEAAPSAGQRVRLQLERPLVQEHHPMHDKFQQEFALPWLPSTKLVMGRQFKVAARNTSFFYARMAQVLILGIFTGTVFYQIPNDGDPTNMNLRKSISFLATMAMALGAVSQIPFVMSERQVFEKQYAARFFRPSSYVLAGTLSQIPFSVCEVVVYTPLIYWLTGMSGADGGAHFIIFVFVIFLLALLGTALTRLMAAISASKEGASGLAGLAIITMLLFTGFLLPRNMIPDWWIWMYWVSPLQYGVTAVACNEFLSGSYNTPCSEALSVAPYCAGRGNDTIGVAFLSLYEMPTTFFTGVWLSILALLGFYVLFTSLTFLAIENLRFTEKKTPPPSRLKALREEVAGHSLDEDESISVAQGDKEATVPPGESEEAALTGLQEEEEGVAAVEGNGKGPGSTSNGGSKGEGGGKEGTLSFVPMTLSFHDLVYEVDVPGLPEPKILLNSISGFVKPGSMTALMGSSGAGKTTLLDVLAGRKTIGRTRGDILINGHPKVQETFARASGYVEQNDIHTPFITVRESLKFSSSLRLPKRVGKEQQERVVEEAMDLLELHPIADKLVGFIGENGLTVEEAKRLTIGVELVANPSILFLDEPTSGLDSHAAQVVIKGIQNIVATGRSIICTIHQPSRRIFFSFDSLYLMKRGGEVVFSGPLGKEASSLLAYFESVPGVPKCRDDQNPANYMLELIGAGIGHASTRDFALHYRASQLAAWNNEELVAIRLGRVDLGPAPVEKGYAASWGTMFHIVMKRQLRTYWRNVSYSFGRLVFSIVLGLLLGSAFYQIDYTTTPGLAARQGLIYVSLVFVAIINANNVIPQVNAERPVYYRENASLMYPALLYDFSWGLAEAPYLSITTLIFCSICFSMAGVATDTAAHFFLFWFVFCLYSSTITFFGILMAVLTPNAETATVMIPIIINIWNIVSGFMIPRFSIPTFWIWLYWLNPTQFALNSLFAIAFDCPLSSDPSLPCSSSPPSLCANSAAACPACTCPRLTDENGVLVWSVVQSRNGLNYSDIGLNILALIGFIIVFRLGAYFGLKYMKYNRR